MQASFRTLSPFCLSTRRTLNRMSSCDPNTSYYASSQIKKTLFTKNRHDGQHDGKKIELEYWIKHKKNSFVTVLKIKSFITVIITNFLHQMEGHTFTRNQQETDWLEIYLISLCCCCPQLSHRKVPVNRKIKSASTTVSRNRDIWEMFAVPKMKKTPNVTVVDDN